MVNLLRFIGTPHRAGFRRYLEDGGDGPGYGPALRIEVRWEKTSRQIQTAEGRVVTVTGMIYAPAVVAPAVGDQFAEDPDTPDWRTIVQVDSPAWVDGTVMHHEVLVE
ncbi:hypothetical protein CFN78_06720 [Amycolatopsis antarctica]|uniref:Uncharacterized protein n=1 Tax=Amycolatopsis antarctica TaxID=1854586 RepID=A0A263D9B7_9PSEU|nr:hypothetical protein [Amycolatopsis antarctica]OZM73975.1 hypothetical protein CFN78_06720 [Amycolatopsis antarctica]